MMKQHITWTLHSLFLTILVRVINRLRLLSVDVAVDTRWLFLRLRHIANTAGIRLAGLETGVLTVGFMPYLTAGCYDVIMPALTIRLMINL